MKKILIVLTILQLGCAKKQTNNTIDSETATTNKTETAKLEQKYVNTRSNLNYRDKPKGNKTGKFPSNTLLTIVEHTGVKQTIQDGNLKKVGEWVGVLQGKDTVYVFDAYLSDTKYKNRGVVWSKFRLEKLPLAEITGFDNLKRKNGLSKDQVEEMQLQELYPNWNDEGSKYTFIPAYRLKMGENYKTYVVHVFKGDHELETVLVNYSNDFKLLKYNGPDGEVTIHCVVLSYDEIAEGWSQTLSRINKSNCITTVDALYTTPPQIDTLLYHVNMNGEINKIKRKFKDNSGREIRIGEVYQDTVRFESYNNDYDYFMLNAKQNGKEVTYIYNWEGEKYNFKKDDLLEVEWKMDTTYIAGDGETLNFSALAIEAKKTN